VPPAEPSGIDAAGVPPPPWQRPRRTAPKAPLTREAIVDAALKVLDAEGMDGLSMRKVAHQLGTGAGSLYWHVRNKEEVLQLILERVTEQMSLPEPDPSRWKDQLRDFAYQMRAQLKSHRDVARISLGRVPMGPTLVVYAEWLFMLLHPLGVPDWVTAYLGDLLALYVGGHAFEESLGFSSPTGEDMAPEEVAAMFRQYALSLPAERFPHTRRSVDLLFSGGAEERFSFGLDILLRGVESHVGEDPPTDEA
jgi:TetR/AcrR family tetracycline transcriptional repressor